MRRRAGSWRAGAMLLAALWVWMAAGVPRADAAVLTSTLPEFDLLTTQGPFSVGTFTFTVPLGEVILSAQVDGTFGNSSSTSSAGADLFLDGGFAAQCDDGSFGPLGGCQGFAWQFVFADFTSLLDGQSALTGDAFLATGAVRLGSSTLTVTTGAPEPAAASLLLLGLLGLAASRRR